MTNFHTQAEDNEWAEIAAEIEAEKKAESRRMICGECSFTVPREARICPACGAGPSRGCQWCGAPVDPDICVGCSGDPHRMCAECCQREIKASVATRLELHRTRRRHEEDMAINRAVGRRIAKQYSAEKAA